MIVARGLGIDIDVLGALVAFGLTRDVVSSPQPVPAGTVHARRRKEDLEEDELAAIAILAIQAITYH